jgi:hypothetical protein
MRTAGRAQEVRPALRETAIALMTMEQGTNGERLANLVGPVLRVQTLERLLGHAYDLRLLEIDMPSFSGRLKTRGEEYVWYYRANDAPESSSVGGKQL